MHKRKKNIGKRGIGLDLTKNNVTFQMIIFDKQIVSMAL